MALKRIRNNRVVVACCAVFGLTIFLFMGCGGGSGGGSDSSAPTPNISTSQSSLDFAGVVLNNSADQTVEITNAGNANLNIGQISSSGPNPPFSIAADGCSNTALRPSNTCSLRVRFAPANQGPFTSTISIPSNDPDSNVVNISLRGNGYGLNVWINKVESSGCQGTIDVTVTDPTSPGTPLDSLNFSLYENGSPVEGITVNPIQPSPVSVVLALDFSGSEAGVLDTIRAAAKSFIDLLDVEDYAAICKFSSVIGFSPSSGLTQADEFVGKPELKSYIDADFTQTGGTLFFTALYESIGRAVQGPTPKQAVVVLSDGIAEWDGMGIDQVIAYANLKKIPIFTIYYVDPTYTYYTSDQVNNGLLNLQRLASESGGQYYDGLTADLTNVFGQIANILSNKYTLTYSSQTCPGTNSLDVRADWNGLYGVDSATITF